MLMYTAFEGLEAIVADLSNYTIREIVPDVNCSVNEGPTSRVGS